MTQLQLMKLYFGIAIWMTLLIFKTFGRMKDDVDEYLEEDQRLHLTKQNLIRQRALNNELYNDNVEVFEAVSPYEADDISPFIVDYANMIRKDVILFDNSVETRTRKRGDASDGKSGDLPCSCEYKKHNFDLGEEHFPRFVETRLCTHKLCREKGQFCVKTNYSVAVLKRKSYFAEQSVSELPEELESHWVFKNIPVTVGCTCVKSGKKSN